MLKALSEKVEVAGNVIAVSIHFIFPIRIAVFKNLYLITLLPVPAWRPAANSIILNPVRVNRNIKLICVIKLSSSCLKRKGLISVANSVISLKFF